MISSKKPRRRGAEAKEPNRQTGDWWLPVQRAGKRGEEACPWGIRALQLFLFPRRREKMDARYVSRVQAEVGGHATYGVSYILNR